MFTSAYGSPKYFGFTFGQNDWFLYDGSPEKDFIKTNFVPFDTSPDGSWSGVLRLRPDKDDPDYKGPGEYIIKVKRYTGESTSAATDDFNQLIVNLSEPTPTPTAVIESPSETVSATPTNTLTPSPIAIRTPTPSLTQIKTPTPTPIKTPTPEPKASVSPTQLLTPTSIMGREVLGDSTSSAEINLNILSATPSVTVKKDGKEQPHSTSYFYRNLAGFGVLLSSISAGALYLRHKKGKIL